MQKCVCQKCACRLVAFAAAALLSSIHSAEASWIYTETNGVAFNANANGLGYLSNGVWTIPATRTKKTANLTVTGTDAVCTSTDATPWDFTTVKNESGEDRPVVSFNKCTGVNVSEVIAPSCVSFPNQNTFQGCMSLTNVELSADFSTFSARAFSGCSSLERFSPSIMPSVATVAGYAFSSCAKLKGTLSFPNCTTVGLSAFNGCALLESVSIPKVQSMTDDGRQFSGCASFESFVWNFPDYQSYVPPSCFEDCSALARVEIKTAVSDILGSAFKNIAPGAELYMPAEAPETIGALAFANTASSGLAPRVYLQDNAEAWLDAFAVNYHVIRLGNAAELAAFNAGWSEAVSAKVTRTRADVIRQMKRDPDICTIDADNGDLVTRLKKGVLAYAVRRHTGNAAYSYGCWILAAPSGRGLVIMVQ